jgi:protein-disulfide isomerase
MRKMAGISIGLLAMLAACGGNQDDFREIRDGQRQIMAKITDLEKKVDQVAARPVAAAAPGQPDPNKVYDIPVGDSPTKGPANASVVLAEFADFQCPFCSKVPPLVDEVLKAYPNDLKFVYKQFPLTSIHANALNASKAALAANRQGKYWEMYGKLFDNQRALDMDSLKKYAQELGLDMAQFEKDMASPEVQKQIDDETKLAAAAQVTGTPTLFINGKRVMNRSPEGLKQMVDEELKKKS